MAWLTDPAVPPGRRNTPLKRSRAGVEVWVGYEERWDALSDDNAIGKIRLPLWMRDASSTERVGLPPDHPWQETAAAREWLGEEPGT